MAKTRVLGRLARMAAGLKPNQRMIWTREGVRYILIWLGLLAIGLYQQINLTLLIAGLAAGPIVGSFFVSMGMIRRLKVSRRVPAYVFSGEPLVIDYTLENRRRWSAALAMIVEDGMTAADRSLSAGPPPDPGGFFPRVPARERVRVRWQGVGPDRGRYRFGSIELATRSPFGLLERRVTTYSPAELIVYPEVGRLTKRWRLLHREVAETRRGQRHDRSSHQQEYHGLRDYRPGDSPRWVHWRTSARVGHPMVKEFEQQNDQDLAILINPWLPRHKVTTEQREAVEQAIRFAATVCVDTCRKQGRRLLLGWTGPSPGICQGPASVKLLHEVLTHLATMRPTSEGRLSALFDAMPASMLRASLLVVVSTQPINLVEEAERSARLSTAPGRGLAGRVVSFDVSKGELAGLIKFGDGSKDAPPRRFKAGDARWEGEPPSHDALFPEPPSSPDPAPAAGRVVSS